MRLPAVALFLVEIVALATVACSAVEQTPSPAELVPDVGNAFVVPWSQQHFGMIAIHVHDQSGLVLGAQKMAEAGVLGSAEFKAVADPEGRRLALVWLGGVCRFGPIVTVSGDAARLVVSIQPDAGARLPPGIMCNLMAVFYRISLNLAMPVQQSAVDLELVR